MQHERLSSADPDRRPGGSAAGDLGAGAALSAALTRFAADTRSDEAVAQRRRQRWLERQEAEDATFVGALVDLAERGRPVVVTTSAGRLHRGWLHAIGLDVVALRTDGGGDVLVALGALAAVQGAEPHGDVVVGSRTAPLDLEFVELLAELAPDRPRVALSLGPADRRVVGELRSVGRDVVTVRLDGDGAVVHVAAGAIAECTLG